eukprot:PhM_4_TR4691/c0_g2_i1/m.4234
MRYYPFLIILIPFGIILLLCDDTLLFVSAMTTINATTNGTRTISSSASSSSSSSSVTKSTSFLLLLLHQQRNASTTITKSLSSSSSLHSVTPSRSLAKTTASSRRTARRSAPTRTTSKENRRSSSGSSTQSLTPSPTKQTHTASWSATDDAPTPSKLSNSISSERSITPTGETATLPNTQTIHHDSPTRSVSHETATPSKVASSRTLSDERTKTAATPTASGTQPVLLFVLSAGDEQNSIILLSSEGLRRRLATIYNLDLQDAEFRASLMCEQPTKVFILVQFPAANASIIQTIVTDYYSSKQLLPAGLLEITTDMRVLAAALEYQTPKRAPTSGESTLSAAPSNNGYFIFLCLATCFFVLCAGGFVYVFWCSGKVLRKEQRQRDLEQSVRDRRHRALFHPEIEKEEVENDASSHHVGLEAPLLVTLGESATLDHRPIDSAETISFRVLLQRLSGFGFDCDFSLGLVREALCLGEQHHHLPPSLRHDIEKAQAYFLSKTHETSKTFREVMRQVRLNNANRLERPEMVSVNALICIFPHVSARPLLANVLKRNNIMCLQDLKSVGLSLADAVDDRTLFDYVPAPPLGHQISVYKFLRLLMLS